MLNDCGDTVWTKSCVGSPPVGSNKVEPPETTTGDRLSSRNWPALEPVDDGNFVVLSNRESITLMKIDNMGNELWTQSYGGNYGYCVRQTSDGGFVLGVGTQGTISWDMLLIKTDSQGNQLWTETVGTQHHEAKGHLDVEQTSDGGYIVVSDQEYASGEPTDGFFIARLDANRNLLWQNSFDEIDYENPCRIIQTHDGSFVVAGTTEPLSPDDWDIKLTKISSGGSLIWDRSFGGDGYQFVYSLVQTADSGFAIAGCTFGDYDRDFYVAKTYKEGQLRWEQTFDTLGSNGLRSAIQNDEGDYVLAGYYYDYPYHGMYIVKATPPDDSLCCIRRGDVNHDGAPLIDMADLVYLVDYMFVNGPPPPCWEEGDVNGSGTPLLDISDQVYLIEYMFMGGPEPPPCP